LFLSSFFPLISLTNLFGLLSSLSLMNFSSLSSLFLWSMGGKKS
jgi:hypothetical protein